MSCSPVYRQVSGQTSCSAGQWDDRQGGGAVHERHAPGRSAGENRSAQDRGAVGLWRANTGRNQRYGRVSRGQDSHDQIRRSDTRRLLARGGQRQRDRAGRLIGCRRSIGRVERRRVRIECSEARGRPGAARGTAAIGAAQARRAYARVDLLVAARAYRGRQANRHHHLRRHGTARRLLARRSQRQRHRPGTDIRCRRRIGRAERGRVRRERATGRRRPRPARSPAAHGAAQARRHTGRADRLVAARAHRGRRANRHYHLRRRGAARRLLARCRQCQRDRARRLIGCRRSIGRVECRRVRSECSGARRRPGAARGAAAHRAAQTGCQTTRTDRLIGTRAGGSQRVHGQHCRRGGGLRRTARAADDDLVLEAALRQRGGGDRVARIRFGVADVGEGHPTIGADLPLVGQVRAGGRYGEGRRRARTLRQARRLRRNCRQPVDGQDRRRR